MWRTGVFRRAGEFHLAGGIFRLGRGVTVRGEAADSGVS